MNGKNLLEMDILVVTILPARLSTLYIPSVFPEANFVELIRLCNMNMLFLIEGGIQIWPKSPYSLPRHAYVNY